MDSVVRSDCSDVSEELNQIMDADNYADKWMLLRTPYPVGFILISYLVFVLKVGPQFMSSREPYKLQMVLRLYNVLQVIYNVWVINEAALKTNGVSLAIKFSCEMEGLEDYEHERYLLVFLAWNYLVIKIFDLFDTVFMVLKKKNSHISFLHLYHHVTMVLLSWIMVKYFKSPQGAIPAILNLIIHAVMYSYYLLATFPSLKKYLWWKVYLTKLQMSQFVLILIYFSYINWKGCPISKKLVYPCGFVVFTFLCLFANFYIKTYIQTPRKQEEEVLKER